MMARKTFFALMIGLALIAPVLAACGTPEPSPTAIPATATLVPPTATPSPPATEPVSAGRLSKATRHGLFMQVWSLIESRYVYADFGGLDWAAVKEEYTAKVAAAADDEEFYALMGEMVGLLGDDHSDYLAPEAVALENAIYESLEIPGGIGARLREIDGEVVLIQVWPGYPAFEAGLQPGERIVAVDGVPWEQFPDLDALILAIIGEAGTEVVLTVRSVDGVERQVPITRAVVDLQDVLVQGRLIEGTRLGLLTFSGFDSPQVTVAVRETLAELAAGGPLEGLIVDVRANGGGDIDVLLDTLAIFIDGGSIGVQAGRLESEDLLIPEGKTVPELAGLPIVVLIGPDTMSAAESFAAGMRLLRQARIVGQPSAGNTEQVSWHELSDGSVVLIAEWVYQLPDGTLPEGRGVQPDVVVAADRWLDGGDDDPQIQAAIELLGSE